MIRPPLPPLRGLLLAALLGLAACAAPPAPPTVAGASSAPHLADGDAVAQMRLLDRVTWGVNTAAQRQIAQMGAPAYLQAQLHPPPRAALPPEAQAQVDAMTISQQPLERIVFDLEARRKAADATRDDDAKKAAQQAYQQELNRLGREAAQRFVLRALYSPSQLQEQMTWFWMNHFNVFLYKSNIRVLVGDYEERAIRPHALGRFRDLLGATLYHPAMIRYLDNEQNAAGRINENYARELMELHTLGVGGGYSQRDVQELARVLTGVGVNMNGPDVPPPGVRPQLRDQYVRRGLFEFNPNRHDYGDKQLLGQTVRGRGLAEVDEALDRLARAPATARFISRKLAQYFVADEPPEALVRRMESAFRASDGNIAATLSAMFESPEFRASLGTKFRDPVHYAIAAVRLAYDERVILNPNPVINWINRMGEPLYGHETPDGYALTQAAWASPGQMTTRFEIARAIGSSNAGLFKTEGPAPLERPAFPQLATPLYYQVLASSLGPQTRQALAQATSPQDWNTFLLSSPELMNR
jgi:uncharacterized protein (DUF1800 family)